MIVTRDSGFDKLPESVMIRVNRVCNQFEQQWRSGERPLIETLLDEVDPEHRDTLLRELLPLEIEYRQRLDMDVSLELFLQRFPTADETWLTEMLNDATEATVTVLADATTDMPRNVGGYTIIRRIGAGGMGTVYEAVHERMDRKVALKVLRSDVAVHHQAMERFLRETRAVAKLSHPNIVSAFDAGVDNGIAYLVTEFITGRDLRQIVDEGGPVSVVEAVDYLLQAARGLQYAHEQGIIHRDVKPANLILGEDGTVKLLDLGLARRGPAEDSDLTSAEMIIGTAAYMAPEQALSPREVDHRADVYGLGCSLYFLLTGQTMYQAETSLATVMAHSSESIPLLSAAVSGTDPVLDAIFRKMVAKDCRDRYESMVEVIGELERLQPSIEGTAATGSVKSQAGLIIHSRRNLLLLAGAGSLLAVAAAMYFGGPGSWRFNNAPTLPPDRNSTTSDNMIPDRWALSLNGKSSYVWAPSPKLPPPAVTMEAIITLGWQQRGCVISWQHGSEHLAIGNSTDGHWSFGRAFRRAENWYDTEFFNTVSNSVANEKVHLAVTFHGKRIRCFLNGTEQDLSKSEYSLQPTGRDGISIGGRSDNAFRNKIPLFLPGLIHAVRISTGIRYTDDFLPPTTLAGLPDDSVCIFTFEEGEGQTTHDELGRVVAEIIDAEWVQP